MGLVTRFTFVSTYIGHPSNRYTREGPQNLSLLTLSSL